MKIKFLLGAFLLCLTIGANAQANLPKQDWFHLDFKKDNLRGVSTEQAYAYLKKKKKKKSKQIVVAVIDSGIDVKHEDLTSVIWKNKKEKANGKDDDKNGYVDDVYGWNFIGGMKDGKPVHVNQDSYELTREYGRLNKKYAGKSANEVSDKKEFKYYLKIAEAYEKGKKKFSSQMSQIKPVYDAYKTVKDALGDRKFTKENIQGLKLSGDKFDKSRAMIMMILGNNKKMTGEGLEKEIKGYYEYLQEALEYSYNTEFNPRTIVGDNYNDKKEKFYGNNSVEGPDAGHGTHVAGIIAANRKNKIGLKGIAKNVKIMVLRVVPNGDERDKDVANAIRYAVDNGAKIINMSFGKAYSPEKSIVDEAVKYAEKKGVLLVHAAGNESLNIDVANNFPNDKLTQGGYAKNWIEVGASSWGDENNFVGSFSNYGKTSVDIFAPGVSIYSSIPDNKYARFNGTSMAAPVVSGVAALLWSHFPKLSVFEVKEILLKSSIKYDKKILKPGEKSKKVNFNELSNTGGIVNAYEAVKMAYEKYKK